MDDDAFRRMFGRGIFSGGFLGDRRRNPEDSDDFGTFLRNDFEQMFRDMDELMRQFNHSSFRIIDESKLLSPPIEGGQAAERDSDGKLRDQFLKPSEPSSDQKKLDVPRAKSVPFGSSSIFDWLWTTPNAPSKPKQDQLFDEDLDQKVAKEGLDKVAREDLFKGAPSGGLATRDQRQMQPKIFSSGQSVSYRRIQRPDGSIEETKTVRNSDGHEERTVTRIIGDKSHSVVEKKNHQGVQETEEIFRNFDENKLGEFNDMWSHFNRRKAAVEPDHQLTDPSKDKNGPANFSIASKLFSWFK